MAEHLIRVVDLETTGRPEDKSEDFTPEVVELAYTDLFLRVNDDGKSYVVGDTVVERFGIYEPMGPEVIAVHHIQNEDLEGLEPATPERLTEILTAGAPLYMAAHKCDFERYFLTDDICGGVKWLDTFKAAKHLYPGPYGNQVLKYRLGFGHLPHDRCMPPHAAGPDSYVTAHILGAMLMETTGQQIEAWTRGPEHHPTCPIGKHKGPWENIPHDYLGWMLRQPDMDPSLKAAASSEIERRRQRQMAHMISTKDSPGES